MMTVEAIANKSFRRTFLGYDLEEVDDFLDEIIRQIQQMEQERRELTDTIDYLVGELKNAGIVPMDRETAYVAEPVSPHAASTTPASARPSSPGCSNPGASPWASSASPIGTAWRTSAAWAVLAWAFSCPPATSTPW